MFSKNLTPRVEKEPLNRLVKKWLTVLTLSLVILFHGCENEDDEGAGSTSTIEPAFVTEWEITSDGESITIPINPNVSSDYNYNVNWGDGNTSVETTDAIHEYKKIGIYTVKITGDFPAIYFNKDSKDKDKIKKIKNWGTIKWESFSGAFYGCSNLELTATNSPDLSVATDLSFMFTNAISFNTDINHWDVSNITDMSSMFQNATIFNQPLNNWDTGNVVEMFSMFNGATNFNQPLNNWNTSNVINMYSMFYYAKAFTNQDLSNWNVDRVANHLKFFGNAGPNNILPIPWQD